jgi:biopolymer transport protein ExbD
VGNFEEEGALISEVSLTPLIDVFLVLLIIFMVTSSTVSSKDTKTVDVEMPASATAEPGAPADGVILALLPSGAVRMNEKSICNVKDRNFRTSGLEKQVRQALEKTTSKLVVLEGDRKADLDSLMVIMDAARRAGARKFAIATSEGK